MDIGRFYNEHSAGMMKYAYALLQNRNDAEDAVSDCVLRLMKSARFSDIDDKAYAKAYAFAALRSVCVTELRRRGRTKELSDSVPCAGEASASEILLDVGRALPGADTRRGRVLRMRLIGEYSVRDISEALGIKESNVKIIIHRGKKELARILGEKYAC